MNCSEWEERISLYAGGDLAPADTQAVEQHVAGCAGCQLLLSGLRQSLETLREAHAEQVDAAHYAAVRARVISKLRDGRARRWRWAGLFAMAAAALVVLAVLWPRPVSRLNLPMPGAPTAPPMAKVEPARVVPAPRTPRIERPRTAAVKPRPRKPSEEVLVKVETDNPDVVIYWIAETKGEEK